MVGLGVGRLVGAFAGIAVGTVVGAGVGRLVGAFVGIAVGTVVGAGVGRLVGGRDGRGFARSSLTRTTASLTPRSIESAVIVKMSPVTPLKSEMLKDWPADRSATRHEAFPSLHTFLNTSTWFFPCRTPELNPLAAL